jgi:hypothetical protein
MISDTGPVIMVPNWLVRHPRVSGGALRLWCYMACRYVEHGSLDMPTQQDLADGVSASLTAITLWREELVAAHALQITERAPAEDRRVKGRHAYTLVLSHPSGLERTETPYPMHNIVVLPQTPRTSDALTHSQKPSNPLKTRALQEQLQAQPPEGPVYTQSTVPLSVQHVRFEKFWAVYPRKVGRLAALKVWTKRGVETDTALWDTIWRGVSFWVEYWAVEMTPPRYILHPSTFLNQERYTERPPRPTPELSKGTKTMVGATGRFLTRHPGDTDVIALPKADAR